jgi:tRNA(Ile)-lysidine synthase
MPPARGIIRRPLLGLSRADVLSYLEARAIPWRNDASNRDNRYFRNRIRNQLVPLLEEHFPGWGKALEALGETQSLAAGFIAAEARRRVLWEPLPAGTAGEGRGLRTGADAFFAQPQILREEALFQGIDRFREEFFSGPAESGAPRRQSLRLFCREARLPEARHPRDLDLGFCRLRLEGAFLVITGVSAGFRGRERPEEAGFCLLIKEPGVYKLNLCSLPDVCRRRGEGEYSLALSPLSPGQEEAGRDGLAVSLPLVLRPGCRDDTLINGKGRRLSLKDTREALPGPRRSAPLAAALDRRGLAAFIGFFSGEGVILERRAVPGRGGRASPPAGPAPNRGDFFLSIGGIDV